MIYRKKEMGITGLLLIILFLAALFIGFFYLMKGLYSIMLYIAPILVISILFIDYNTFVAFGRWLGRKYKKDIFTGITWTAISILGFPFVLFVLLYRALFLKNLGKSKDSPIRSRHRNYRSIEYHDYEIVDDDKE